MSEQQKRELCKAFAYDVDINTIAELGGMTVEEAEQFKADNAGIIAEIKLHYSEMEGAANG